MGPILRGKHVPEFFPNVFRPDDGAVLVASDHGAHRAGFRARPYSLSLSLCVSRKEAQAPRARVYSFFTKEEERKCPVSFFLIFENILFRVFVVPSIESSKKERKDC